MPVPARRERRERERDERECPDDAPQRTLRRTRSDRLAVENVMSTVVVR
jgi:hypothetical protein